MAVRVGKRARQAETWAFVGALGLDLLVVAVAVSDSNVSPRGGTRVVGGVIAAPPGLARCLLGNPACLVDLREALGSRSEAGQGRLAATCFNILGIALRNFEGPRAGLAIFDEGRTFAEARGLKEAAIQIRTSSLPATFSAGGLQETLQEATELSEHGEAAPFRRPYRGGTPGWSFGTPNHPSIAFSKPTWPYVLASRPGVMLGPVTSVRTRPPPP